MTAPNPRDRRFRVSESQARELVSRFETPLYIIDETHFRDRIREYLSAFQAAYPKAELSYASKANSALALLAIAHQEGCKIDVASEGELRAALAAGVSAADCFFHGNNKSAGELRFALSSGIGHIVVDHFGEIDALRDLAPLGACRLVLRLAPGVDPVTHHKISTGQADTKFGFNIADGSAEQAVQRCLSFGLPLRGFHCHVGSQLLDPEAQEVGGETIAEFARDMAERHGFKADYLNVGGGLGVRYQDRDEPMGTAEYCRLVVGAVTRALAGSGLDPTLGQEPGRSLIAESGVTLYQVGVVKTVPAPGRGTRTYVAVDGGLSDNPRPALYGSRYVVERVAKGRPGAPVRSGAGPILEHLGGLPPLSAPGEASETEGVETVTVCGRHCETDTLFEDVTLPDDLDRGDVLQVLCTGAYNASMASNYNRYRRPACALIRTNGSMELIQRRESWDEMLARELVPGDLR